MRPFHFGSSQKTLFGIHHPPQTAARSVGVVLCNPMGMEAVRGHRAYRQLANLLNKARFHVLRFDYFGTGDSGGAADETSPSQWIEDIGTAADELKDITGVARVSFVGLRFGATLAWLAGKDRTDLDGLVLWDPIVSGAAYLEELRAMHLDYMNQELGSNFTPPEPSTSKEALGFPLSSALAVSLTAINLAEVAACSARNASLIVSKPGDESRRLRERLASLGVNLAYQEIISEGWNSDEAMNAALVPHGLLQAIVARLAPPV